MQPLIAICLCLATSFAAKLPSSFIKCDHKQTDFEKCLPKAIENAIKQLTKPIKEVGLASMDPLKVPSVVIGAGSGAVGFDQDLKNLTVTGFKEITCPNAKFDPDKKTLMINCSTPSLHVKFQYEVSGKVLVLPIYGKGPGSLIMDNVSTDATFILEEYEKKGIKYYKVKDRTLSLRPKLLTFHLENLFNGNKELSDNINSVLNENWKALINDGGSGYENAFGTIFAAIFDRFLRKVPISELWW